VVVGEAWTFTDKEELSSFFLAEPDDEDTQVVLKAEQLELQVIIRGAVTLTLDLKPFVKYKKVTTTTEFDEERKEVAYMSRAFLDEAQVHSWIATTTWRTTSNSLPCKELTTEKAEEDLDNEQEHYGILEDNCNLCRAGDW
jgi:hypothetical protein